MEVFRHFFVTFLLFILSSIASANNSSINFEAESYHLSDPCNVAAPDSFRVTSVGYQFFTLAWRPAFAGAEHHLTVIATDTLTGTDSLYYFWLGSDSTYTLQGIDSKKSYELQLRTVCSNGEPGSEFVVVWPDGGTIIELVLGGRTPLNATPIACKKIEYFDPNNEWVGFQLTKNIEGVLTTSLFEVELIVNPAGFAESIKYYRLDEPNILVAAEFITNTYPTLQGDPDIDIDYLFKIGERDQNGVFHGFGTVNLVIHSDFSINLCASWNPNSLYSYETLVASEVMPPICNGCPPNQTISKKNETLFAPIVVQNPVTEFANIFFPDNFKHGECKFQIVDMTGKEVMNRKFEVPEFQATISLESLNPGFYTIIITTNESVQSRILVKQ